jgi:hypothetical protein
VPEILTDRLVTFSVLHDLTSKHAEGSIWRRSVPPGVSDWDARIRMICALSSAVGRQANMRLVVQLIVMGSCGR